MEFVVYIAGKQDVIYADAICELYRESARVRGTGIAKREPAYIRKKMIDGDSIIAICGEELAGFCYIETFEEKKYVSNSGLIVVDKYRGQQLGRKIKKQVFNLARDKYPYAKIFGITTSLAVMKINYDLGYQPVTFSELTTDEAFWNGCSSCPNYDILTLKKRSVCLCTAMIAPSKDQVMKKDLSDLIIENQNK